MRIQARLAKDRALAAKGLEARGFKVRTHRDGMVTVLPPQGEDRGFYIPSAVLSNAQLSIEESESGGGRTKSGRARIVASPSGKPLWPFSRPHQVGDCESSAYFSARELVTVDLDREKKTVEIAARILTVFEKTARIEKIVLWAGDPKTMPATFDRFGAAVKAAQVKAGCYHCTHIHYAAASRRKAAAVPKTEERAAAPAAKAERKSRKKDKAA